MFWAISVYFNIRNTLLKSGTFLLGYPVYIYIYIYIYIYTNGHITVLYACCYRCRAVHVKLHYKVTVAAKYFCLHRNVQTGCGSHQLSRSTATAVLCLRQSAWGREDLSPPLVSRLEMNGIIRTSTPTPVPAWCGQGQVYSFFFFLRHYNFRDVLAFSTSFFHLVRFLMHSFQFVISIFVMSLFTSSSHLFLGLPSYLVCADGHSYTFFYHAGVWHTMYMSEANLCALM